MSKKLKIDPALADWLPPIEPEELTQLRRNLERDGCLTPIIHWNGIIIDGHSRYALCDELNIPHSVQEMEFDNIHEVKAWMVENQSGRRNWTVSQAAMMADKWLEEKNKGKRDETLQNKGSEIGVMPGASTSQRAAADKFKVDQHDVAAASTVRAKGADELIEAVETNKIPVRTAAKIAQKPKSAQRRAVARKNPAKPPKEKPAQSEPAKVDPVKDDLGNLVPDELLSPFAAREVYDDILNRLTALTKLANPLLGSPKDNRPPGAGGEFLSRHLQRVNQLITDLRSCFKFARPYALCPRKHLTGKCPACVDLGWVTKEIYDHAGVK